MAAPSRLRRWAASLAIAIGVSAASALPAAADDAVRNFRAHLGFGAEHPLAQSGWRAFVERLAKETPPAKLDIFLNGPAPTDAAAIENLGRGDYAFGAAALPAFPNDFPYAALLAELGLAGGEDELAASAAITELLAIDCIACQGAFQTKGLVFLGAYSAARYVMICRTPTAALDAFRGLKVATPGSAWDRLMAGLGAVADGQDEAGARFAAGELDALIATPMRLADPAVAGGARHVLAAPFGAYRGGAAFLASAQHWGQLDAGQRRAAMNAAADGLVAAVWGYQNLADAALNAASAGGLSVSDASPTLADAIRRQVQADNGRVAATAFERFGVADGPAFLERFLLLYDKYAALLAGVADAPAAAEILRLEIFDRMDAASYGLEQG